MKNLISTNFWLNQNPPALIPSSEAALIAIILIFTVAFIAFIVLKRRRSFFAPLYGRLSGFSIFNAVVGALICLFSQQMIPFLSARFWLIIWGCELVLWAIFIIKYAQTLPDKRSKALEEKNFKKYLP
jgi:hypothetical protein